MKNKQSAHTNVCRPCSCSPLRIRLYSRDKIGGFVVQGILRFTNPVLSFSGHLSGRRFSADCTKIMFLLASQYVYFTRQKYFMSPYYQNSYCLKTVQTALMGFQPAVFERKNVDLCPISETHWNRQTNKECIRTGKDILKI